jgi:hypothetical protein
MGRRARHPPAATRRTKRAAFAGKRKKTIFVTTLAPQPKKPVFQNPTFQIGPKFGLDETRNRAGTLLMQPEKRLELFSDHRVQQRMFGIAGTVDRCRTIHAALDAKQTPQ